MDSSRACRPGAGTVRPLLISSESDASRPERSFATQGQNQRSRENTDKTDALTKAVKQIISIAIWTNI